MTKFVLIIEDENKKTRYFGPFDDGEKALEWGEQHFDGENYFMMSTTLYDPADKEKK